MKVTLNMIFGTYTCFGITCIHLQLLVLSSPDTPVREFLLKLTYIFL